MSRYRKLPVVIEAVQFDGTDKGLSSVIRFIGGAENGTPVNAGVYWSRDSKDFIKWEFQFKTLEGTMTASPGDWIIKGVRGEFYPCKPDIFAATYEVVEDGES